MTAEFVYGLLAEHLLLGLLFVLLAMDMFAARARVARSLVATVLAIAGVVLLQQHSEGLRSELAHGELRIDQFALVAKLVLVGAALLWSALLAHSATIKSQFLLCSSLLGALIMMNSAGFISLFIGLEMLSLPAFALMIHNSGTAPSSEAAFKYLLLSSVATALVLFGMAFAYGAAGSLAIAAYVQIMSAGSGEALAATVLIASGFFMKAAVFPFHGWAPDAYGGAQLPITGLLASLIKGAVVLALLRIVGVSALPAGVIAVMGTLAVASIVYGNIAALRQTQFRRLLAYSSIAHAGYMIAALLDTSGARLHDLLWYVAIYAAAVIIACAAFARLQEGGQDDLAALDGAFHRRPATALMFGAAMLSLAGLPPLPGFFAKLFVFSSVIASGHLLIAVLAFVGSFIGATYYLRLFFRLFAADSMAQPAATQEAA